jgi:F420-dependent oxidoreductase-like protein
MKLGFWPAPDGTWETLVDLCRHAEATGWDGIWFSDHFMPDTPDRRGPMSEAWTSIAALAASVPRVRIGTLVTCNTYRHPAVLAKMAANVDMISSGRMVLGLGAGWHETEHTAYGIPFYTVSGRLRRLEEACQVITSLLANDRTTFNGRYYQLEDAPLEPKPIQNPVPLLIGGGGEQMTMRIAATYANEWNVWGTPATLRHKMAILDQHCRDVGRDPKAIKRSALGLLLITDDKEAAERARNSGHAAYAGTIDEVRAIVQEFADIGLDELIIPGFNLGTPKQTMQTMDRFIHEVAGR